MNGVELLRWLSLGADILAEADEGVAQAPQLPESVEGDGGRILLVDHHLVHVDQAVVARHRGGLYLDEFVVLCHGSILE